MSRFILRLFDFLILLIFMAVVALVSYSKITKKEKVVVEGKQGPLWQIVGEKSK
ncbi:hypothetical protein EM20IM_04280 [Candidatus Methylacidiphilum infernorum]|uniref:Uncharacterized protein n=1 Tax=Candidatus Methylacidiphilum infernorum TaxID=511746 RepID=A0ABX7PX05_9BACT|nr:hypothetical protein [Candidatus Methylacidiphilum infernorum]QSR87546.1 hypothetical protein EM20IM_04280 [Candidatus Methylacidiphilum infernorum]